MIQWMLAIWSLIPLPFLNPAWTCGSSWFIYCWILAWRILSITLLVCEMSAIVWQFEHSLALSFFGIGMKSDLFQSCGHCWVFQMWWHIGCSTFTASSFRIWNSSTGIPSPLLGLFVVMFPKAEEPTHWKRPWCWERLKAGEEGDDRGWDGWMASLTWWTWVWVSSRSWWWTGRPGVL